MMQLRQSFTVKTVPLDAQVIDPDMQVLLVAQAQNLSDATLYAIDQFVMRGGRLMADGRSAQRGAGGRAPRRPASRRPTPPSDLNKLFDAWGIVFDPTRSCGDLDRRLAGARRRRATGCRRSTTSPGSTSATASTTTTRRPPTCSR